MPLAARRKASVEFGIPPTQVEMSTGVGEVRLLTNELAGSSALRGKTAKFHEKKYCRTLEKRQKNA
jgi:hypothetical protein